MDNRTQRERREALERFEDLLTRRSLEAEFQSLFSDSPFILSDTLPVKLQPSEILPLARRGKSDPDFIIYPNERSALATYGVIELKRPDMRIFSTRRRGILTLSSDAGTAVAQARVYTEQLAKRFEQRPDCLLIVGNRTHSFVIMGLSTEVAQTLGDEMYRKQADRLLPKDCGIIPYDTLLSAFRSTIPPQVMTLVPAVPHLLSLRTLLGVMETQVRPVFAHDGTGYDGTDEAFQFWEDVEGQWRRLARQSKSGLYEDTPLMDRSWFGIPGTDRVALESDGYYEYTSRIRELIRRIDYLAREQGLNSRLRELLKATEIRP